MTHYLRDDGKTLVDIEATKNDIQCVVNIAAYSRFMMSWGSESRRQQVIEEFDLINEIRGLYFESEIDTGITPDELAARELKRLAKEFFLGYVTD